ncbi:hypothetical protein HanRHA438_Chr03g0132611 [Helianthus annuus]|nr:hypothetical protein HanRHA438_Chr03g0132611 [Helianthus annuus]
MLRHYSLIVETDESLQQLHWKMVRNDETDVEFVVQLKYFGGFEGEKGIKGNPRRWFSFEKGEVGVCVFGVSV